MSHPTLDNPNPELPWFYDCSSFTAAMYNMVCNQEVFGWEYRTGDFLNEANKSDGVIKLVKAGNANNFKNECLPGDIVLTDGHVEIFISAEKGSGGAHTNHTGNVNAYSNSEGQVNCGGKGYISPDSGGIYRLTEEAASKITDLNTEFSTSLKLGSSGKSIKYSNFFFNGIPDGTYSLATRKSIFEVIIDALKALLNWLVGLITYILRGVIISFISVFDRLLNNSISAIEDNKEKSLQQSGVTATSADDPLSENRSITIEELVFNDIDLFDINIFRVD